jgi:hypothetical protein
LKEDDMGIVHREFTYKGRIKVSPDDLKLAILGRKRCTIRLGKIGVAGEHIALTDGKATLPVRITGVDASRTFVELDDQDARDEGFTTRAELVADLKQYYRAIDDRQPITVIYFDRVPSGAEV